jgi:hypothetical protein
VLEVIASMPAGTRSKADIDRQLAGDQPAGRTVAEIYLDTCCFIYLVERTKIDQGALEHDAGDWCELMKAVSVARRKTVACTAR